MDISRIKYLCEFTIKANTNKDTNTSMFPSYDEYIQEAAPEEQPLDGNPAPKVKPVGPPPSNQPPAPAPQPAPNPEPIPAPAPEPMPEPAPEENSGEEEAALMGIETQIQKTDAILQKLSDLTLKLDTIEKNNIETVEKMKSDVEEIKNPSLDKQLDNIASKSFPFNVQLDDYFKWNEEEVPKEKLEINVDDIENYSDDEIKDSF